MNDGESAALLLRYPLAEAMAPYLPLQIAMALTGLLGLDPRRSSARGGCR